MTPERISLVCNITSNLPIMSPYLFYHYQSGNISGWNLYLCHFGVFSAYLLFIGYMKGYEFKTAFVKISRSKRKTNNNITELLVVAKMTVEVKVGAYLISSLYFGGWTQIWMSILLKYLIILNNVLQMSFCQFFFQAKC